MYNFPRRPCGDSLVLVATWWDRPLFFDELVAALNEGPITLKNPAYHRLPFAMADSNRGT